MAPPAPPVLALAGVGHRYGTLSTFADLDLSLASGEICCLLGPSGCGKTTVLRCIGGFERIAAGRIALDGTVVSEAGGSHLPPEQRRIGMVFQDFALFPHLDVARNVAFGIADRPGAAARAAELLAAVGLEWAGARWPHELSGGQQQRVALARALAPAPRLLLLDEPFSNLDAGLREVLAGDVRAILKAAGSTAVFVTHDQDEAFAMADRIAVMNDGRIQQIASAYDLYHRPGEPLRRRLHRPGRPGRRDRAGAAAAAHRDRRGRLHRADPPRRQRRSPARPARASPCCCGRTTSSTTTPVRSRPWSRRRPSAAPRSCTRCGSHSGTTVLALVPSHHNHAIGEPIGIRLELDHVIAFAPLPGDTARSRRSAA